MPKRAMVGVDKSPSLSPCFKFSRKLPFRPRSGINDAPSLHSADVGNSIDSTVAKEATWLRRRALSKESDAYHELINTPDKPYPRW
jgi:hypothetical protein